ncbi:hypothetical protein LLE49_07605 [Alicyclobacillus tolerans]|uniref:LptM family lipoprotein n=1 Tax=Alicyclobacillus tolerans TaxID=90970 RepID=UPI001F1C5E17|nr:hypothetical protein [Alicyclobacillus tolerans]MCF8564610.1 hypothetical protein [Alicyclobacillus tolerans]
MKRTFLLVLITLFLSGCGQTQAEGQSPQKQTSAPSWAYELVNWNHHIYKVTSETVSSIGEQVGSVTNYSDVESTPQKGTFSNAFPVGTKLFAIPNVPTSTAFAVQTKNGYLKAVDVGAYGQKGGASN